MTLEILTGLLVIITGFYAWATFKILKANESVVEVARLEAENISRPYINIFTYTIADNPLLYLGIENTGKTSANNLKLNINNNFYQFGEEKEGRNLKEMELFTKQTTCFPPGSKISFYLGIGSQLFNEKVNSEISPLKFTIAAEYEYGNKKAKEETAIDLNIHLNSALVSDPVSSELKNLTKSIDKLPKSIGKELNPNK